MFNKSLRTALMGSGAALALMAGPAMAGESEDLKTQINQLQSRLDQLEKQQAAQPAADVKTAAAPADAVVGGDFPGSFKLPGSDTSVAIHGYTKLDAIYSFDAKMGDSFVESSIPGNRNTLSNQGPQLRMHARQSRLTFETRTPTNYGQLNTYIQTDFFGNISAHANGTNNTSGMRLRQAYGTLGNFLAGQTWTNFTDLDDQAETLDFFGPAGTVVVRAPQVRYTYTAGKWKVAGALENPAGTIGASVNNAAGTPVAFIPGSTGTVQSGAGGAAKNGEVDRMPDVTASVNYTDSWGHAAAAGVIRYFAVDNGGKSNVTADGVGSGLNPTISETKDTIGGGFLVGATINWGQWVGGYFAKDQIGFNGYWGEGINRYIEASSRQGDAILFVTPTGGGNVSLTLDTQSQYGGFIWLLHNWTDQLRTNVAFGIDKQDWKSSVFHATNASAGTQIEQVESIHANLIWSPVKAVNIGVEYMWGYNQVRNLSTGAGTAGIAGGSRGTANQLQFSAQYVF